MPNVTMINAEPSKLLVTLISLFFLATNKWLVWLEYGGKLTRKCGGLPAGFYNRITIFRRIRQRILSKQASSLLNVGSKRADLRGISTGFPMPVTGSRMAWRRWATASWEHMHLRDCCATFEVEYVQQNTFEDFLNTSNYSILLYFLFGVDRRLLTAVSHSSKSNSITEQR